MDAELQTVATTNIAIKQLYGAVECKLCGICGEMTSSGVVGHLELECNCVIHYACLVNYVQSVSSLLLKRRGGIVCPYAVTGECQYRAGEFYIQPADLHLLVEYYDENISEETAQSEEMSVKMTAEEVEKILSWVADAAAAPADEAVPCRYMLETSKPCPKCSTRVSHFSGHGCHHVMGCPSCGEHWCYKCSSTGTENLQNNGYKSHCLCGSWSTFCYTGLDTIEYIDILPYPRDSRCGCPLCPECRPGQPCGSCPGNCVVCMGHCLPGPNELVGEDWVGLTPDMIAVRSHAMLMVKHESLMRAMRQRDTALVDTLISTTPELLHVRDPEERNTTPLHLACLLNYDEAVEIILRTGAADVNSVCGGGASALHWACRKGFCDGVTRILEVVGCDVNIVDGDGYTPLMRAMGCRNDLASEILQSLLAHPNIDVNVALPDGRTALFLALDRYDGGCNLIGHFACYHGLETSTRNENGMTALLYATQRNFTFAVHALVNEVRWKQEALTADSTGCTCLMYASLNGNTTLLKVFLRLGIDVTGEAQYSPEVQVARFLNDLHGRERALILINDARDTAGQCTMNYRGYNITREQVVAILKNPVCRAQVVAVLERSSMNPYINQIDSNGKSALYYAMGCGNSVVVSTLLAIPLVDVNGDGKHRKYPFNVALAKKNDNLVSQLLARQDMTSYLVTLAKTKESTLIYCTKYNMENSVHSLLGKQQVDANYRDQNGMRALDYAMEAGNTSLISYLLPHTGINQLDTRGTTLYMDACRKLRRPHCQCGHELAIFPADNITYWTCAARQEPSGCVCGTGRNRTVFNKKRYRCIMGCDFSYCEPCVNKKYVPPRCAEDTLRAILIEGTAYNLFCQTDCNGMTALMHAVSVGNVLAVDILLEKCSDGDLIQFGSFVGKSALSVALALGHLNIANKLLDFLRTIVKGEHEVVNTLKSVVSIRESFNRAAIAHHPFVQIEPSADNPLGYTVTFFEKVKVLMEFGPLFPPPNPVKRFDPPTDYTGVSIDGFLTPHITIYKSKSLCQRLSRVIKVLMDMIEHGDIVATDPSPAVSSPVAISASGSPVPESWDSPLFDIMVYTDHIRQQHVCTHTIGDCSALKLFPGSPHRTGDSEAMGEGIRISRCGKPIQCKHCGYDLYAGKCLSPIGTINNFMMPSTTRCSCACQAALDITCHPFFKYDAASLAAALVRVGEFFGVGEEKSICDLDFRYALLTAAYVLRHFKREDKCAELCRIACTLLFVLRKRAIAVSDLFGHTFLSWIHEIGVCMHEVDLSGSGSDLVSTSSRNRKCS